MARLLPSMRLKRLLPVLDEPIPMWCAGKVLSSSGLSIEAQGLCLPVGTRCEILVEKKEGGNRSIQPLLAEVIGFNRQTLKLMAIDRMSGLMPGTLVIEQKKYLGIGVGAGLIGRVINGLGMPIDSLGPLSVDHYIRASDSFQALNPLDRKPVSQAFDVGVRLMNGLLTVGVGQRLGIFAGSGVGKSVLLGMMAKFSVADVVVVGLIGERGREVKEFIESILGEQGMKKAVVVASPADDPPLMRIQGAHTATVIAEFFREQGKKVLLIMDSLTRYAQAYREVALAGGEPPATKGYPPSVFAKLPQLVERSGNAIKGGSITAFYTVLAEGDDQQDPVVDCARAILDGHVVLSRTLAESGIYPAIDIEASISRVMPNVTDKDWMQAALELKRNYSFYRQNEDLIRINAYVPGTDAILDAAIAVYPRIIQFLTQEMGDSISLKTSLDQLKEIKNAVQQLKKNLEVKTGGGLRKG